MAPLRRGHPALFPRLRSLRGGTASWRRRCGQRRRGRSRSRPGCRLVCRCRAGLRPHRLDSGRWLHRVGDPPRRDHDEQGSDGGGGERHRRRRADGRVRVAEGVRPPRYQGLLGGRRVRRPRIVAAFACGRCSACGRCFAGGGCFAGARCSACGRCFAGGGCFAGARCSACGRCSAGGGCFAGARFARGCRFAPGRRSTGGGCAPGCRCFPRRRSSTDVGRRGHGPGRGGATDTRQRNDARGGGGSTPLCERGQPCRRADAGSPDCDAHDSRGRACARCPRQSGGGGGDARLGCSSWAIRAPRSFVGLPECTRPAHHGAAGRRGLRARPRPDGTSRTTHDQRRASIRSEARREAHRGAYAATCRERTPICRRRDE